MYSQLQSSTIQSNTTYQEILQYGVDQCIQNLIQNNIITNSSYQVSQIFNSYIQQVGNQENCQFQVQLANSQGNTLNINLGVNYQQDSGTKALTSYFIESSTSEQDNVLIADYSNSGGGQLDMGTCKKVTSSEIKSSSDCQAAIQYGVSQVTKKLSQQNSSMSGFQISQIQNVYQDVASSQTYRVVATLTNTEGTNVDCSFSVNYGGNNGVKQLNSCSYFIY